MKLDLSSLVGQRVTQIDLRSTFCRITEIIRPSTQVKIENINVYSVPKVMFMHPITVHFNPNHKRQHHGG